MKTKRNLAEKYMMDHPCRFCGQPLDYGGPKGAQMVCRNPDCPGGPNMGVRND